MEQLAVLTAQGQPADLVQHFARPLAARVIFDQLGVPESMRTPLVDNLDTILRLELTLQEMIDAVGVVGELLDGLAVDVLAGKVQGCSVSSPMRGISMPRSFATWRGPCWVVAPTPPAT